MKITIPSPLVRGALKIVPSLGKRSELKFWSIVGFAFLLLAVALITITAAWYHNIWLAVFPWLIVLGAFAEKIYKRIRHGHFRCGVCDHSIVATQEAEGVFGPHPHPAHKGELLRVCKTCAEVGTEMVKSDMRRGDRATFLKALREKGAEENPYE